MAGTSFFDALILTECLMSVLMVTIWFRTFFAMNEENRFLAVPYFLCSIVLTGLWIVLPWFLAIPASLAVLALYLRSLFSGSLKKMVFFSLVLIGLYGIAWTLCLLYLEYCTSHFFEPDLILGAAIFLSELLIYIGLFAWKASRQKRKVPLTYYFPCIPVLITFAYLYTCRVYRPLPVIVPVLYVFFIVLLAFDFGSLAFQSWIIASLNTRAAIRFESIQREYLEHKYQRLKKEYQKNFGFLHGLLRSCADLSVDIEKSDMPAIESKVKEIAATAFEEFNEVCINAPVLSELLRERKEVLEKEGILVSTVIRSDHFGLLTFAEQKDLFEHLLDYAVRQIDRSKAEIRTLVIKSMEQDRDIVLYLRFPSPDPERDPLAEKLRLYLSDHFHAGLQFQWNPRDSICSIVMMMPSSLETISWNPAAKQDSQRF